MLLTTHLQAHADALVSDDMLKAAVHRFPDNTPRTKEAYWYRTLFEGHFPQRAAAETVPGGPSVACSTPTAALWDAAWAGNEDPSGARMQSCVMQLCLLGSLPLGCVLCTAFGGDCEIRMQMHICMRLAHDLSHDYC